jgi:hypothetical protein
MLYEKLTDRCFCADQVNVCPRIKEKCVYIINPMPFWLCLFGMACRTMQDKITNSVR